MHRASPGKATYFNQLRHYPESQTIVSSISPRNLRNAASPSKTYSVKFNREMTLVHNYQHMMDARLSQPKTNEALVAVSLHRKSNRQRFYKNSQPDA